MRTESLKKLVAEIDARLDLPTKKDVAGVRTVRREFSKRLASAPGEFVFRLAVQLLAKKESPPRFFVYELIQHHRDASRSLNSRKLKILGEGMDSWAAVDTFASYLSGPAWREHLISDALIARWARSRNRWWRRAAVVSTVSLNNKARGGAGDAARTLQVCNLIAEDRDDMVVKALSWALRELAKRDAEAVKAFLKDKQTLLSSRVVREVTNKLTTGLKNPTKNLTQHSIR